MSTGIPFVDLWGLRGLWCSFEKLRTFWGYSWEPEVWGPWVPFVHFLDFLRTFWTLWGILEDLRTWCSQNVWRIFQERLMTSCEPIEDLMPLRISMTFQDIEDFGNLITYWGLWGSWFIFEDFDVALNTFCGPMRTSRDLRPFWGNRGDFWGIIWEPEAWGPWVPFVPFLDLIEDFVDLLRTF